ncbi:MAG: histidine kinase, partial [Chloroflexota bacterium]
MNTNVQPKLSQRIQRLRWQAPVLALLLVVVHQLLEHTWLMHLPRWQHFTSQILFYGLLGPLLAWWALTSLRRRAAEIEAAHQALNRAHTALAEANQRLEFLVRVSRRLAEAEDEVALIEVILNLPQEVVPAVGCSLVRFDERGQPLPVVHQGELDPELLETWATQLSVAEVRQTCRQCATRWATAVTPCPLLQALPAAIQSHQVYCLTLNRGERQYGVLNIYLPDSAPPLDGKAQTLLTTMASEMSLALESHHLRSRELATLYRLQQARRLSNLQVELAEILPRIVEAVEIDGGCLFLTHTTTGKLDLLAESGQPLTVNLSLLKELAASAQQTSAPLVIGDFKQEDNSVNGPRSLLIAPLHSQDNFLGSLALWSKHKNVFTRRRTRLVATVAEQMALLIENHRLYLQVEQQAALAERARLAREIHDSLAQTLSYLKLSAARIAKWLSAGEAGRAQAGLEEARDLLTAAYIDAREAIDNLRLKPGSSASNEWLDQALLDFQSLSGVQVEAGLSLELILLPEIQTQLLRIVQE